MSQFDPVWLVLVDYVRGMSGVSVHLHSMGTSLGVSVDPLREGRWSQVGSLVLDGDVVRWRAGYGFSTRPMAAMDVPQVSVDLADPDCFVVIRRWVEGASVLVVEQEERRLRDEEARSFLRRRR